MLPAKELLDTDRTDLVPGGRPLVNDSLIMETVDLNDVVSFDRAP